MNRNLDKYLDEAWDKLTAPGAEYELTRVQAYGRDVLGYVNAPANMREIWLSTQRWGDRDYIVFNEYRLTYAQAHGITSAVRAWLAQQGIGKGDRVAIAMRNYPEWMLIYWACMAAGVVVVGFNAWWVTSEMTFALNDSDAKAIFCDAERLDRLPPRSELNHPPIVVAVRAEAVDDAVAWEDVIAASGPMPEPELAPEDDVCILYTSGTTGVPKGAQLTNLSCMTSFMNQRFSGDVQNLAIELALGDKGKSNAPEIPVALATTPLFHVTATNTLALPITFFGGKLVLMHKWDAAEALRLAEAEGVTHLTGVPLIVREFVAKMDRPLPSLYILGGGGAPFGPDLVEKIAHLDPPIVASAGYGMTEVTGSICIISREFLSGRPMSSGRALPGYETKLVETQTDDLGRTVGELCVKGGSVIKGYLNRPDATSDTIIDGWLHTGDVAHIDEQGYVFIVDRKKDMVLRGGENVYCVEVEAALYRHPSVAEACVFGVKDERLGEEVGAAIMLKPGTSASKDELCRIAAEHLAAYKVPRHVWLLDTPLPRNASGKIVRRELQQQLVPENFGSNG